MTDAELGRLLGDAAGPAPAGLDAVEFACPGDAAVALRRVREVLAAVVEHSGRPWPDLDEWVRLLPGWFVDRCVDDVELRDCVIDRWSLRAWIYWFQPELRHWRWWDGAVEDGRVRIRIEPIQRPYLRGALDWLVKVACEEGGRS